MELTADTTERELARLSIPSRGSQRRRRTLERLANVCTDPEVRVAVRFSPDRACCRVPDGDETEQTAAVSGDGSSRPPSGGWRRNRRRPTPDYEVVIPTRKYEQVSTAMLPRRWDKRVQVALLFHELGHVTYSDFGRFATRLESVEPEWQEVFRTLYNAAEDGVIETQMAAEFNVREDFVVLNSTFAELESRKHDAYVDLFADVDGIDDHPAPSDAGRQPLTYTVLEALTVGLLDRGFGNSDRFAAILDPEDHSRVLRDGRVGLLRELEPSLDDLMTDLLAEPDGTHRVERCYEFFETVRPQLQPLPRVQLTHVERQPVVPDDVDAPGITNPDRAHLLPGGDVTERHVAEQSTAVVSGVDPTTTGDGTNRPPGTLGDEAVERAVEALDDSQGLETECSGRSPLEAEADRLRSFVTRSETTLERAGVAEPEPDTVDRGRWQRAKQAAAQLRADLGAQLRRRRRTGLKSGFRTGGLDPHRLVEVKQGSSRVFVRREAGDDRDYSCIVVLDRSASMDDEQVDAAEDAAAQLVYALSSVGVDVSVLSVWETAPWLEVPFGSEPDEHVDRLLTGRSGGGTPLSSVLEIARDRVHTGNGHEPMVFVLTDGFPDDESAYKRQLDRCTFPVFGLYLSDDVHSHHQFFDHVVSTPVQEVDTTLRNLVRNLLR